MSKIRLYSNSLFFEVYLIGYNSQGESILFFLRTDEGVIYSGVVDCYTYKSINKTIDLLKKENIEKIDFLCWTHPHDDHSLGIDKLLDLYCDSNTKIWISDIYPEDLELYSASSRNLYQKIKEIIRRKKSNIKFAKDNTILDKFICQGLNSYSFEIQSFSPNSTIIAENKEFGKAEKGNPYSIGLSVYVGRFNVMLAGDVENTTISRFDDTFFDSPIDYIKIPHHGSSTGDQLPIKLNEFGLKAPSVATSIIFIKHHLPQVDTLQKYKKWGTNEIYVTNSFENFENTENYGIIVTSFDVLEKREYPIETKILGNSILYSQL